MADNVSVTSGSYTATIAADEVVDATLGTVEVQYVKVMDGTLNGTNKLAVSASGGVSATVQGTTADGVAVSGNPVLVAGIDNVGNTATIASDTSGRLAVVGAASVGVSWSGNPVLVGYTDITGFVTTPLSDSVGRSIVVGGAANGSAVTGNPVLSAGYDGTATRTLRTDSSGNLTLGAGANKVGSVSLGNSTGKTIIGQPGTLVTTATTADQVIKTYTVTAGKTFYIQSITASVRLTTYATTATSYGTVSIETPSGTKIYTEQLAHAGIITPMNVVFAEPLPIAASTVIRVVCTPAATTSFTWLANIIGYEI
jgi:hypothetical protein